jgi:dihydropteroate synthase
MHNRPDRDYTDYIEDVIADLQDSVDIALSAGIDKDKIIIDPGIGFAKDLEQNLILTNRLQELGRLGYPILLATSRKSMIGLSLDLPSDERVEGTIATSVLGVMKGASFVRVHDVKENKRAIEMTRAILNEQKCL